MATHQGRVRLALQVDLHAAGSATTVFWCPVQLADFGFSKDPKQQSEAKTRVGTPAYLAPEVIAAQPGKSYDAQVMPQTCGTPAERVPYSDE